MSVNGVIGMKRHREPILVPPSAGDRLVAHACLAACLVLAALPVLLASSPPIFDYANHLARIHIIARLDESAVFRTHFTTTSFLIPNVLSDLVLLALAPLGVLAAGKILLLATFAATLTGAYALGAAASGGVSVWPLFAALLLYNEGFFWGFLNYDLGLGLLLWGLAAWVYLDGRGRRAQLLAGAAFALAIFLAHLVAFGLYAVSVAALELRQLARGRAEARAAARRLAASAAQFLPPLVLFFGFSPASGLDFIALFDFSVFGKIMPFARLLSSGNPPLDLLTGAALVGVLACALAGGLAACHPAILMLVGLTLLLVACLPYSMMGSFFLDSRITIAVALTFCASLRPRARTAAPAPMAILLMVLVGLRSLGLVNDWEVQDQDYARVRAALDRVPEGAALVPAIGHHFELGGWIVTRTVKPAHEHTAHYATIARDVVVPTIFARYGQNPLVFGSPLDELDRFARNPVPRLFTVDDARWLAAEAGRLADRRAAIAPAITGVFVIAHHVACDRWPPDLRLRLVVCDPMFSLVEVIPADVGEPVP